MRKVWFAVAVFAVHFGCSSSGDTPTVSADQACTDFAATLCDQIQNCAAPFVGITYGDAATCKARTKIDCLQANSAPSSAATASDIAACAAAAKSAKCADLLNNVWPNECAPKSGGVADGAPCGTDSQCKSAFCGLDENKEVCGVCAVPPVENGPCVRGRCPRPFTCSQDGTTCSRAVAVGGACDPKKACAAGSHCYASKCVADVATEGSACDENVGPNCDGAKGFICLAKKCVKLTLVGAGVECGIKFEGTAVKSFTLCEKSGWCKGIDTMAMPPKFTGTCEAAAADGQACVADADFGKGPGCVEPAECIAGKCTLPDATTCK